MLFSRGESQQIVTATSATARRLGLPLVDVAIAMAAKPERKLKIVADNRKARFNYAIGEVVRGRHRAHRHRGQIAARRQGDDRGILCGLARRRALAPSTPTSRNICRPTASITRPSGRASCCCIKRQINKLIGAVEREGMTLVPLKLYFNEKGRAKVELALARGKKLHDKRESEKKRSWDRDRARLMRERG